MTIKNILNYELSKFNVEGIVDVGPISGLAVDDGNNEATVALEAVDVLHLFFSQTERNHSTFQLAKLQV